LSSERGGGGRRGVIAVALVLALAAAVPSFAAAPGPRFSGARAMRWLRVQCDLGSRVPGSPAIEKLRRVVSAHADSLRLRYAPLCFRMPDPYGPGDLELCNLVISAGPPGGRRLWLAAHYDSRPRSDRESDPRLAARPMPGANDGASGTAVLLALADLFAAQPPPRGVDLILLDGEDYGREGDIANYCLGSAHLAATWRDFGCPLAEGTPEGLILLDMVGKKGLSIPMEGNSLAQAPDWTRRVFARADALGLAAFAPVPGPEVYDDHVAFLRAGIPAVDLIDFDFPEWHTTRDTPAVCSPASLEQVGRLLADLAYGPAP
jgi:glutaminyl-peptide cyclotransferase